VTARYAAGLRAAWLRPPWLGAAGSGRRRCCVLARRQGRLRALLPADHQPGRHLDGRRARRGPHPVARRQLAHPPRKRGTGPYRRPRRHGAATTAVFYRRRAGRPPPPHPAPCHRQRAALRRSRVNPVGRAHRVRQRGSGRTVLPRRLVVRVAPAPHHHAHLRRIDRRYRQPGAGPGRPDHQRDLRLAAGRHRRGARPGRHHVTWSVLMLRYLRRCSVIRTGRRTSTEVS